MRFGPFHADKATDQNTASPVGFSVKVFARSPAFYNSAGNFAGASAVMKEIGSGGVVITEPVGSKDFFVTVTLPSIFTALRLQAYVGGSEMVPFPQCSDLPSTSSTPDAAPDLDRSCMQAAIDPLAVLVPNVVPLAIIYEPPGNCSYANLTTTHTAGSSVRVQDEQSTSAHTIKDPGLLGSLFGDKPEDFTSSEASVNSRTIHVTIGQSRTLGTVLGGSNGDPCNGVNSPPRDHSGPGEGDAFILLIDPTLIYWNTGNLANTLLLSGGTLPHTPKTTLQVVYAWQLKSDSELAKLPVHLSREDANAILSLDPLVKLAPPPISDFGPFTAPKLPARFVEVKEPLISLAPGAPLRDKVFYKEIAEANSQVCSRFTNTDEATTGEPDLVTNLVFTGLKFDVARALGTGGDTMKDLANTIKNGSLDQLTGSIKTTTSVTCVACQELDRLQDTDATQEYFVRDTNQDIYTVKYYDSFFGTIAFVPLPHGMGVVTDRALAARDLPNFVWNTNAEPGRTIDVSIPATLRAGLTALGVKRLVIAPQGVHASGKALAKGLPDGVSISPTDWKMTGLVAHSVKGRSQALMLGEGASGKSAALVWINVNRTMTQ